MRAVIVHGSMFGNTHAIADAIGKGLEAMLEVVVVPMAEAGRERLGDADLLVVGGPTQFHGMSRTRTRKWAAAIAQKPSNDLVLDRDTQGPGVRDCSRRSATATPRLLPSTPAATVRRFSEVGRRRQSAESLGSTGRGGRRARELLRQFEESPRTGRGGPSPRMGKRLAASIASSGSTDADRPGRPAASKET